MDKYVCVENSIHYSSNNYSGKIISFDELTPIFIGYKKNKTAKNAPSPPPVAKRFCYVIHFFKKGSCYFFESGNTMKVSSGDVIITKPHTPVSYHFDSETLTDYAWIGFYGNYAKKLDNLHSLYHLSSDYFSQIENLLNSSELVYAEHVNEILFDALTSIFGTNSKKNLDEIKAYLDENYMKNITIESIAKTFSYNRTYLSQIFKNQFGCSLKQYLTNKRLSEGMQFILEGKSVFETAYSVGYNNPYNFSNAFKAKYGAAPSKYSPWDELFSI